jgi:chaperonin GroEL (HSP60 family)
VAGELLGKAEDLINKGVHPTVIVEGYGKAADKALETLENIAIPVKPTQKEFLEKVAATSMASKLVSENKEQLAEIAVGAVLHVAQKIGDEYKVDLDDIMVEKKPGESVAGTKLIEGLVLDKEVVHSGMPKRIEKAKIALLDSALEVEKTEFDAKINIESPEQIESFMREEENMLNQMVEKIVVSGANVVVCQKGIDDMVQHFLARKGILAVQRAKKSDMEKLGKATGGKIVTNLEGLAKRDLGYAEVVEERKIGDGKMTFIEGCKNPHSVAILIRGGTERFVDEAERSVHDALCVVRDVVQEPKILAGGGSPEMEIARALKGYAESVPIQDIDSVETIDQRLSHTSKCRIVKITMIRDKPDDSFSSLIYFPLGETYELHIIILQPLWISFFKWFSVNLIVTIIFSAIFIGITHFQ